MRLTSGPDGKRRARELRRQMSLPEILLWRELRRQTLRYRRQHPAGPYTLDFYCALARLVIEVDGQAHGHGDRPARDDQRDVWLADQGVITLRINAADVLRDLDAVLQHIMATVSTRLPPPPLRGSPPPPSGGGIS